MVSRDHIAKTLKKLRNAKGYTAEYVGSLIGKSGKTVSAWEVGHGQPDAEMLINLCDIYEVDNILAEFAITAEAETKKPPVVVTDDERENICNIISDKIMSISDEQFYRLYKFIKWLDLPPTEFDKLQVIAELLLSNQAKS